LLHEGRGGELLRYFIALGAWGAEQTALTAVGNWPLVLIGLTLVGLVWLLRSV
jgi:hypothetical protein